MAAAAKPDDAVSILTCRKARVNSRPASVAKVICQAVCTKFVLSNAVQIWLTDFELRWEEILSKGMELYRCS